MRKIRLGNPQVDRTYKTYLSTDYISASSGVSLHVLNRTSFSPNDLVVIGEPREELTEEKMIATLVDIDTVNLASALNFSHSKSTAVYKVLYDFVSIEARSSSAGTFAEVTQSPIQWDNKDNETIYFHQDGTDSFEYRFRFLNTVTDTYSEYSPTITGAGFTKQQVGFMVGRVRQIIADRERKIVSDNEIISYFNTAQDIIYARNPKYFFLKVDTYKQSDGISVTVGEDTYSLATYENYGHLDRVRYRYVSGGQSLLYNLTAKNDLEFESSVEDLNQTGDDHIEEYRLLPPDSSSDPGYLQVYPKPITSGVGTLFPVYYKVMPTLDTVEDETPVPLPQLLENFAIAQCERLKGNDKKAKIYEEMFYGNADTRKDNDVLMGLAVLDQLDNARKRPQGQPRSLWNYRGQDGGTRYLSRNKGLTSDDIKERYM